MKTYPQRHWEEAAEGEKLPGFAMPISFRGAVMMSFASWDGFPGHSDREFARAQGQKDIYLNTYVLQGFADRVATEWGGPATFIARRKMVIVGSVYPDDMLTGGGTVERVYEEAGQGKADLAILLATEAGTACRVSTTVILPKRGG